MQHIAALRFVQYCYSAGVSSAQAGGIAVGVIAFIACIIAQFVGVMCYKKGACRKGTPHPSQTRSNFQTPTTIYPLTSFPTVGSNTMSHTVYASA